MTVGTESMRTNDFVEPAKFEDFTEYKECSIEDVMNTYSNMVYRLAFARTNNKSDADDVFQEVFLRYVRNRPEFNDEEHRKAWLIRLTVNCSNSLLTSAWFRKTVSSGEIKDEIYLDMKEESEVYRYIMELPVKYRTVIHLFYYEEYSVKEISGTLKVKETTVKSQLHRARNILKEKLKGEEFDV